MWKNFIPWFACGLTSRWLEPDRAIRELVTLAEVHGLEDIPVEDGAILFVGVAPSRLTCQNHRGRRKTVIKVHLAGLAQS